MGLVGFAAGLSSGVFGVGGGTVIVPMLVLVPPPLTSMPMLFTWAPAAPVKAITAVAAARVLLLIGETLRLHAAMAFT